MENLTSRPFEPNPDVCCEACVFGRGPHADWCPHYCATAPGGNHCQCIYDGDVCCWCGCYFSVDGEEAPAADQRVNGKETDGAEAGPTCSVD